MCEKLNTALIAFRLVPLIERHIPDVLWLDSTSTYQVGWVQSLEPRLKTTGHFLAMGMILFSTGFLVRTIGLGLMGLLNATKNGNCYAWVFDFHLQKDKAFAATCCNIPDFASAFIVGIYFLFISKDWAPLFMYI